METTKRIIEISSNGRKNMLIYEFLFVDYYLLNLALESHTESSFFSTPKSHPREISILKAHRWHFVSSNYSFVFNMVTGLILGQVLICYVNKFTFGVKSLIWRYVVFLSFFILQKPKETFSSRLQRSHAKVAQIGADDYPSSGRNTPVHDLGFPDFPSFQEAVAPPPPPPDLPLLAPPLPDVPLLPPPAFPDFEKPRLPVPVWPSLPECLRFKSNLLRVEFWVSSGTAVKGKDRFCNRPSKLDPNPVDLKTVRLPSKFRLKKLLCRVESSEVCFGDGNEKDTNPSEIDLDSLPFDLKMVILTRLSAKSLTNFKRVSKMWSSIIGSQRFIDSFFTMSSKQSRFVVALRSCDSVHGFLSVTAEFRHMICNPSTEQVIKTISINGGQGWRHIEVTNAPFSPVTVGVSIDGFVYYGAYSPTPPMNPVLKTLRDMNGQSKHVCFPPLSRGIMLGISKCLFQAPTRLVRSLWLQSCCHSIIDLLHFLL
ncbi:T17H7.3 [Arabidopsis thaliana]|nr:T17H7.3 [Arabidopsis thaliana]